MGNQKQKIEEGLKDKRTNNNLQNTTQKTKDRAIRTPEQKQQSILVLRKVSKIKLATHLSV